MRVIQILVSIILLLSVSALSEKATMNNAGDRYSTAQKRVA
jgi:hypothetical protein